jgi:hypothetical protein
MNWLHRLTWAACVFSFASSLVLYEYATRPRPERAAPQELYAVVQQHLTACRTADFPRAYHEAASGVQERCTLVEFERRVRRNYLPVAMAEHVEYGAVRHPREQAEQAMVDVYFISRSGEANGWTFTLLYEDGDWKVDHGEPIPGWPSGERLSGLQL